MLIDLGLTIINLDQVRMIEDLPDSPKGRGRCHVTFTDGTKQVVAAPFSRFERCTGTIVPAPAGYTVVVAYEQDDGEAPSFDERPILAFRADGATSCGPLDPITDEGLLSDMTTYVIRRPDGRCINYDRDFDSLDAFKADFLDEITRRRARKCAS